MLKISLISILFLFGLQSSFSQNLFPNPDFEEFINSPTNYNEIDQCKNWNVIAESPDYFNSPFYGQSSNIFGISSSGTGCVGMYGLPKTYTCTEELQKECIQGVLIEPLEKCINYRLAFDLTITKFGGDFGGSGFGNGCLSFGFTFYKDNELDTIDVCGCWNIQPTISIATDSIPLNNYQTFVFEFTALDNYDKVVIGPVCNDSMFANSCFTDVLPGEGPHSAYFNLDNMSLERIDEEQLISFNSTLICQNDTVSFIENLQDSIWNWDWDCTGGLETYNYNGNSSFYFPESGNYAISLSTQSACGSASFSYNFSVNPTYENIDIDSNIIICEYSVYTIPNKQPNIKYIWSDNVTGPIRHFEQSNNYIVNSSDNFGCHSSSDTISVKLIDNSIIFPNPTTENWRSGKGLVHNCTYALYDTFGKKIMSNSNVNEININCKRLGLNSGEYLLRLETNNCVEIINLIYLGD